MQLKKLFAVLLLVSVCFLFSGLSLVFAQRYQPRPNESISVSVSPKSPVNGGCRNYDFCTWGVYRIRATGGSVRVRQMSLYMNANYGTQGTVEASLYNNNGTSISGVSKGYFYKGGDQILMTFDGMNITIPAGDYADIYVKGVPREINNPDSSSSNIYVSLSTKDGPSIVATGIRTGNQVNSYSNISLPYVRIWSSYPYGASPFKTRISVSVAINVIPVNEFDLFRYGEKLTLRSVELNAITPGVKIMGASISWEAGSVAKLSDSSSSASDQMIFSLSGTGSSAYARMVKVVVYATGVSNFSGKIYADSPSGSREIPITVTYR